METIKEILSSYGYMNKKQLTELAEHFPCTKVVIKWGAMEREVIEAWRAAARITEVEKNNIDYCRNVFFRGREMDLLRTVFAIAK